MPHLHPGGEAAVAVEGVIDIMSAAPGCMGVLYDGAIRGVHRDTIARFGGLMEGTGKGVEKYLVQFWPATT